MDNSQAIQDESTNNWFRKPPIQRQRWGDTQVLPHVNWGDLFFDLFYVAAAYNLSYIIKTDTSFLGLIYFLGCFGPLTNCLWMTKTMYDSKFQLPDDVMHLIMEVFQLCAVATAVLHVRPVSIMSNPSTYPEMFAFSFACWSGLAYTMLLDLEIRFWGVVGQHCAKYSVITNLYGNLPSFLLLTASTLYSGILYFRNDDHSDEAADYDTSIADGYRRMLGSSTTSSSSENDDVTHVPIILLLLAWLVRWVAMYPVAAMRGGKDFKNFTVPMNIEFVIHRYGEWTMLMLGESVLSLLIVDIPDEGIAFYGTFFAGVLSVTLLQYLYFKTQPHHASGHAMRRSRVAGIFFSVFIQFYSAALIIVGVSYKMLVSEFAYGSDKDSSKYVEGGETKSATMLTRFLAGGSDPKYSTEERKLRTAIFFCIGLAFVFLTLDVMTFTHKGLKASIECCYCPQGHLLVGGVIMVILLRATCILFIGTAFLYNTDPLHVSAIGLASIIFQLCIRAMGRMYFPHTAGGHHDHKEIDDEEVDHENGGNEENEDHWPNTTQAASVQN